VIGVIEGEAPGDYSLLNSSFEIYSSVDLATSRRMKHAVTARERSII